MKLFSTTLKNFVKTQKIAACELVFLQKKDKEKEHANILQIPFPDTKIW